MIPGGFFFRGTRRSMCPNKRVEVLNTSTLCLEPLHEITRTATKFFLVSFRGISWIVSNATFG